MTAFTADFGESPLHRSSRVQKASEVTLQATRIVSLEGLFERGHGAGMVAILPTPVRVWMTALAGLASSEAVISEHFREMLTRCDAVQSAELREVLIEFRAEAPS